MVASNKFLTPKSLWEDFGGGEPLKTARVGEMRYDGVTYGEYYFSGRETETDRVRIFGLYVVPDDGKKTHNSILYVPDVPDKVSYEVINDYVALGFSVLSVDLYGKREGAENYTKYPEDISYANYEERGRHEDYAEPTAKETCQYEWLSVLRYGLDFLAENNRGAKIGVVGVKSGGDLAWQLLATDDRPVMGVIMFGAGWSAYRGIFRYSDETPTMDEERRRFIAAVDAHAYAPYVNKPVLFLTSTNNEKYDFDRATDTLSRMPEGAECYYNFAANYNSYLDEYCKKDVEIFLSAKLGKKKFEFRSAPEVELAQEGNYLKVKIADTDASEVKVYASEGSLNPARRDWDLCEYVGKEKNKNVYGYVLKGNDRTAFAYCTVKYRSGWTVSSKVSVLRITGINPKRTNLLYTGKNGLEGITFYDENAKGISDIFVKRDDFIVLQKGADDIYGAYSKYGLITYRFGASGDFFDENSMIKLDVYTDVFSVLNLAILKDDGGKTEKYSFSFEMRAGNIWQNKIVKVSDFKSADGMSIKKFDGAFALLIEGDGKFVINNVLII